MTEYQHVQMEITCQMLSVLKPDVFLQILKIKIAQGHLVQKHLKKKRYCSLFIFGVEYLFCFLKPSSILGKQV